MTDNPSLADWGDRVRVRRDREIKEAGDRLAVVLERCLEPDLLPDGLRLDIDRALASWRKAFE